jgi:hypothetical protein
MSLPELLQDINVNKKNLLRTGDGSQINNYPLYVILLCMNGLDTLLVVNEINIRIISNLMAHDFLIAAIPKKKRYNKWLKRETNSDIDLIMNFYNYSRSKAIVALAILTTEQITEIKTRYDGSTRT